MSNFTKNSPVGVDAQIQALQTLLYGQLLIKWNLTDSQFNMFGRAYRNQTEDGYTPEVFMGGVEYQEVFFDDKVAASAFFGLKENIVYSAGSATADAFLIMMVNLDQIKTPNLREDEAARIDVQTICSQIRAGFKMVGFATGIDNVFSEYSGWRKTTGIKYKDQHPLHCFRINFKLLYNIKN